MAGLQYGEGRMMIDSLVWAQYINVREHRQPRRHSKFLANARRRAAKMEAVSIPAISMATASTYCVERR